MKTTNSKRGRQPLLSKADYVKIVAPKLKMGVSLAALVTDSESLFGQKISRATLERSVLKFSGKRVMGVKRKQ